MAEEHVGPRPAAWTKIFTGFKVALDLKKLALAGLGVLATAVGWYALSWLAYTPVATEPKWNEEKNQSAAEKDASWTAFKSRHAAWNLLHELAGPKPVPVQAADVA